VREYLTIQEIVESLKSAPRLGAEKDDPEGARYIQISDTLVNLFVLSLERHLEDLWHDGIDRMGEDA
jgi:hypothetical protein